MRNEALVESSRGIGGVGLLRTLLATLLTVASSLPVAADSPPLSEELRPGLRVRVRASTLATPVTGRIVLVSSKKLLLQTGGRAGEPLLGDVWIPTPAIVSVDLWIPNERKNVGKAAAIGAAVGGVAAVPTIRGAFTAGPNAEFPRSFYVVASVAAVALGATYGAFGALVANSDGHWERIDRLFLPSDESAQVRRSDQGGRQEKDNVGGGGQRLERELPADMEARDVVQEPELTASRPTPMP